MESWDDWSGQKILRSAVYHGVPNNQMTEEVFWVNCFLLCHSWPCMELQN